MKYTTLDTNGLPTAFYSDDIHGNIPTDARAITDEQWLECINNSGQICFKNGVLIPYTITLTESEIFAQTEATYNQAVQEYIVSIAQKKGYRDDVSCASYLNDPHPLFAADAQAFVPWRSSVWLQCYADLAAIKAGTMPMPASPDAYILTLPAVPAGF
jgi:hypothetical protein